MDKNSPVMAETMSDDSRTSSLSVSLPCRFTSASNSAKDSTQVSSHFSLRALILAQPDMLLRPRFLLGVDIDIKQKAANHEGNSLLHEFAIRKENRESCHTVTTIVT